MELLPNMQCALVYKILITTPIKKLHVLDPKLSSKSEYRKRDYTQAIQGYTNQ